MRIPFLLRKIGRIGVFGCLTLEFWRMESSGEFSFFCVGSDYICMNEDSYATSMLLHLVVCSGIATLS